MSAQTTYGFSPAAGVAGGIVDLAPIAIDSFNNEENAGVLKFGMGVVFGTNANGIKKPVAATTGDKFVGITVNGRTTQYATDGSLSIANKATLGVMRYGRIYALVKTGVTVAAGDALYLVKSGNDAGKFTNAAGADSVAVNGRFDTAKDSAGIAQVTLYNAPAIDKDTVYTLPVASASVLGGVKAGSGVTIAADGTISVG